MDHETKLYSASEFVQKLKQDDFEPKTLVFTGMLQTADDDAHLMFAPAADCTNWIAIPIESIESIEFVKIIACKDHTHPLVHMTLKEPASEEGRVFASLAKSRRTEAPAPNFSKPELKASTLDFQQFFDTFRLTQNQTFRRNGPNEWFPCWSHCMDDLLKFASEQPPEQWKFWSSLAYQLCGQVCP